MLNVFAGHILTYNYISTSETLFFCLIQAMGEETVPSKDMSQEVISDGFYFSVVLHWTRSNLSKLLGFNNSTAFISAGLNPQTPLNTITEYPIETDDAQRHQPRSISRSWWVSANYTEKQQSLIIYRVVQKNGLVTFGFGI